MARLQFRMFCDRLVTTRDKLIERERPAICLFHIMWKGTEMSQQDSHEMAPARQSAAALAQEAEERDLNPAQVAELRPFAKLIYRLRNIAVMEEDGAFEIAAAVIDEIALADSIEAVFAANEKGPEGADEYLERTVGAYGVKFWKSAEKFRKGTLGYYVAISAVDFEGNEHMVTVGASNVVASVFRLMELGAINGDPDSPCWIKIHGRETANGTLYILQAGENPPF